MVFKKLRRMKYHIETNEKYIIEFGEYVMSFNCYAGRIGTIIIIHCLSDKRSKDEIDVDTSDILFDLKVKRYLEQMIERPVFDMVFHNVHSEEFVSGEVMELKKELSIMIGNQEWK